jgi:hypothetical protein
MVGGVDVEWELKVGRPRLELRSRRRWLRLNRL